MTEVGNHQKTALENFLGSCCNCSSLQRCSGKINRQSRRSSRPSQRCLCSEEKAREMEGRSMRCMVVPAPADIPSQGTGRDGSPSLVHEIKRAHHDGAVLADSPGTCCPPHLMSNTEGKDHREMKVPNLSLHISRQLPVKWFCCLASGQSVPLCRTTLLGIRVLEVKAFLRTTHLWYCHETGLRNSHTLELKAKLF